MILQPPKSTRTDTRFPYTTLFRSPQGVFDLGQAAVEAQHLQQNILPHALGEVGADGADDGQVARQLGIAQHMVDAGAHGDDGLEVRKGLEAALRSEEGRVRTECVVTGKYRGSTEQ